MRAEKIVPDAETVGSSGMVLTLLILQLVAWVLIYNHSSRGNWREMG
jgi:hypothetical protein